MIVDGDDDAAAVAVAGGDAKNDCAVADGGADDSANSNKPFRCRLHCCQLLRIQHHFHHHHPLPCDPTRDNSDILAHLHYQSVATSHRSCRYSNNASAFDEMVVAAGAVVGVAGGSNVAVVGAAVD